MTTGARFETLDGLRGVAAVFVETHQDPDNAPSDGPNMIRLEDIPSLLADLVDIDRIAKRPRRK